MSDGQQARVGFEGSQPILRVEDMQASLHFYVDLLGFKNQPWGTDEFTSVNRDRAGIYLCRGGQGAGRAWIWIGVNDISSAAIASPFRWPRTATFFSSGPNQNSNPEKLQEEYLRPGLR